MARWVLILSIKGGHRYFKDNDSGRIGVADDSGPTPDRTDFGLLWLDPTRPVELSRSDDSAAIPLLGQMGAEWTTSEGNENAIRVARFFGMQIRCGEFKIHAEVDE